MMWWIVGGSLYALVGAFLLGVNMSNTPTKRWPECVFWIFAWPLIVALALGNAAASSRAKR